MPHYCAFGCKPSGIAMHRFPDALKFPERFNTWVALVGGKLESESDYDQFRNKRICDRHFADTYKNRSNRLNALTVPTLYLSGQFENIVHNSTSTQQLQPMPPASNTEHFASDAILEPSSISEDLSSSQAVNTGNTHEIAVFNKIALEHNYASICSQRKASRKDAVRPLYAKIKPLRAEISRLRKKGQTFKTRLRNAEALSKNRLFEIIKMTKPAQLFLRMQLQASKKQKGRRFSIEEKILSLSLFKKSPKSYAHLCKFFTLPSAKAMKRLLSAVKINPGINPIIFEKIKKTILEKPVSYRLCSLIFDEMSLTPHLNYNAEKDMFEGFATTNVKLFADHALVFMIKGLKEPFKQPIAYYFTANLNKYELKNYIKTVVKHAQDSGLIIINTVCDQSTVNVGAITELINEARSRYIRLGKELVF